MSTSSVDHFFEKPILNSPYEYPAQHWELDKEGQPTNRIISRRRRAEYITPIPKPKKRRSQSIQGELTYPLGTGYPQRLSSMTQPETSTASGKRWKNGEGSLILKTGE